MDSQIISPEVCADDCSIWDDSYREQRSKMSFLDLLGHLDLDGGNLEKEKLLF